MPHHVVDFALMPIGRRARRRETVGTSRSSSDTRIFKRRCSPRLELVELVNDLKTRFLAEVVDARNIDEISEPELFLGKIARSRAIVRVVDHAASFRREIPSFCENSSNLCAERGDGSESRVRILDEIGDRRSREQFLLFCERTILAVDFALQPHQAFEQRFRPRRTTGDVNIHRNELIDPLQHGVTSDTSRRVEAQAPIAMHHFGSGI